MAEWAFTWSYQGRSPAATARATSSGSRPTPDFPRSIAASSPCRRAGLRLSGVEASAQRSNGPAQADVDRVADVRVRAAGVVHVGARTDRSFGREYDTPPVMWKLLSLMRRSYCENCSSVNDLGRAKAAVRALPGKRQRGSPASSSRGTPLRCAKLLRLFGRSSDLLDKRVGVAAGYRQPVRDPSSRCPTSTPMRTSFRLRPSTASPK